MPSDNNEQNVPGVNNNMLDNNNVTGQNNDANIHGQISTPIFGNRQFGFPKWETTLTVYYRLFKCI